MVWQLEDAFGFLPSTCGATRTILLCDKSAHEGGSARVNELLQVCSYFLRCTQVAYPPVPDSPGKLYGGDDGNHFNGVTLSDSHTNFATIPPSTSFSSASSSSPSSASAASSSHSPPPIPALSDQDYGGPGSSSASWIGGTFAGGFPGQHNHPFSQNFSYSLYGNLFGGYVNDMAISATSMSREDILPKVLEDLFVS